MGRVRRIAWLPWPHCGVTRHCTWSGVSLEVALTKTARPLTPNGIRLLAELAMLFSDRTSDEKLTPEGYADWVRLFAVSSAATMP